MTKEEMKATRKELGLSQRDLGRLIYRSGSIISMLERGLSPLHPRRQEKILAAFERVVSGAHTRPGW